MGQRPRVDPEAVRAAQPGEAWVIQAGHAVHLRVLPPPAGMAAPAEPASSASEAATVPLPERHEPARVGIAAAVAHAARAMRRAGQRAGRRRKRGGRLPSPGWQPAPGRQPGRWPWPVSRPIPGRGRR
jgi:hypothetical protein